MITKQSINEYNEKGYLLIDSFFSKEEIQTLNDQLPILLEDSGPRKVTESSGEIRSYYGPHQVNDAFKHFCAKQKLLEPVMSILEDLSKGRRPSLFLSRMIDSQAD